MELRVEGLVKRYGATKALDGVTFTAESGRILAILGPSGSGKTTLLKVVAGLVAPDAGRVYFDDRDVTGLPPQKRKVGYVFQSLALFPHMRVKDNIAFPLEARGRSHGETEATVRKVVDLTSLQGLEDRYPRELSGGQQQRVALARAIAAEAELLLLDEPLASLDTPLRASLLAEIKRVQEETGMTTLYVTHDQGEALSVGRRLMVIFDGKIEALGEPFQVYVQPPTSRVASFLGFTNRLKARVLKEGPDHVEAEACQGFLTFPRGTVRTVGKELQILFRPDGAELTLKRETPGQLEGVLRSLVFEGRRLRARVMTDQGEVEVTVARPESYPELLGLVGKKAYVLLRVEEALVV